MFIDSHCHLYYSGLVERLPSVFENMREHNVTHALCASVNLETLPTLINIAQQHQHIFASVGIHPDEPVTETEPTTEQLCALAQAEKVVAIGETGLDYFKTEHNPVNDMTWQQQRFRRHIQAAIKTNKPLIIHTRAAAEHTLNILREEKAEKVGGVMHCFTESWEVAQQALDLGFYISISGIVTFKNAKVCQEVAQRIPEDRLLIETDSPFLAPVPMRGKTNEPAFVSHVGSAIAKLRGISVEKLAQLTTNNFFRLFKISEAYKILK